LLCESGGIHYITFPVGYGTMSSNNDILKYGTFLLCMCVCGYVCKHMDSHMSIEISLFVVIIIILSCEQWRWGCQHMPFAKKHRFPPPEMVLETAKDKAWPRTIKRLKE
jgi:hypothetical protein